MRVLIIGCGYVGFPLGIQLHKEGHEVFGLKRSAEGTENWKSQGIEPLIADITQPETLATLPTNFDWVIHAVSSSKGGAETYKNVYLDGTQNVLNWLKGSSLKKFVYTSSTSVYGQTDGSLVKETSPTEPANETSKILVATEQLLLKAHQELKFPVLILRIAGIYGPDRGHLFHQYLKNEARMHGKGERIINMVYLEDLVGAILSALKGGRAGEIYNVVDDEPVTQFHFFRWLSEAVGKYMPPSASEEELAGRKRGLTTKKVSNRRLKMELGFTFKFPTFRQGYTAEMIRLERAGNFNITPDPR